MECSGCDLFRRKILSFTLAQMGILSGLLICSVMLRIFLFPCSHLESVPLYIIVGFFFLVELFQLLCFTRYLKKGMEYARGIFRKILWTKGASTVLLVVVLGVFFTNQYVFFLVILMLFLTVEVLFDMFYFCRIVRGIR